MRNGGEQFRETSGRCWEAGGSCLGTGFGVTKAERAGSMAQVAGRPEARQGEGRRGEMVASPGEQPGVPNSPDAETGKQGEHPSVPTRIPSRDTVASALSLWAFWSDLRWTPVKKGAWQSLKALLRIDFYSPPGGVPARPQHPSPAAPMPCPVTQGEWLSLSAPQA